MEFNLTNASVIYLWNLVLQIAFTSEIVSKIPYKQTRRNIDLMLSHINSYKRDKLNNRSAYQLFSFIYGESILNKLNVRELQPNDIVLSPKLLRK